MFYIPFHPHLPTTTDTYLFMAAILIGLAIILVNYHQPLVAQQPETVYDLLKQATHYMEQMTHVETLQLR